MITKHQQVLENLRIPGRSMHDLQHPVGRFLNGNLSYAPDIWIRNWVSTYKTMHNLVLKMFDSVSSVSRSFIPPPCIPDLVVQRWIRIQYCIQSLKHNIYQITDKHTQTCTESEWHTSPLIKNSIWFILTRRRFRKHQTRCEHESLLPVLYTKKKVWCVMRLVMHFDGPVL